MTSVVRYTLNHLEVLAKENLVVLYLPLSGA